MNDKPTDYFGNEIEVGDTVAYATSASSNVAMNHGHILEIRPYEDKRYDYSTNSYGKVMRFKLKLEKLGAACYGSSTRPGKRATQNHDRGIP